MISSLNNIGRSRQQVVIMGCGRLGASVATELAQVGNTLHILDLNPANFDRLPAELINDGTVTPIVGDGTLEEDLRRAAIEDAEVFIALSGRDTRNALAAQIAQHIFEVPTVVCRMNDITRKEMYEELGLTAISPIKIVTQMVVEAAQARV